MPDHETTLRSALAGIRCGFGLELVCIVLLCVACGNGEGPDQSDLQGVLARRYQGSTLCEILDGASGGPRAQMDCVLAFRTVLGSEAGNRLARAIEQGMVEDRDVCITLLDLDLGAAVSAVRLLDEMLRDEQLDDLRRLSLAGLILEVRGREEVAGGPAAELLTRGLQSRDVRLLSGACAIVEYRRLAGDFVVELMGVVELGVEHPIGAFAGLGALCLELIGEAKEIPDEVVERLIALVPGEAMSGYGWDTTLNVISTAGAANTRAATAIIEAGGSTDPGMRRAACRALANLAGESKNAESCLEGLKSDSDATVRAAAQKAVREVRSDGERLSGREWGWVADPALKRVLEMKYRGRELRELLADSRSRGRSRMECVLGFRALLGSKGAEWLAKAVRGGFPRDAAIALLCFDLDAASNAIPTLKDWRDTGGDLGPRYVAGGILLTLGVTDEESVTLLRQGLREEDEGVVSSACAAVRISERVAAMFVEEAMQILEQPHEEWWTTEGLFLGILTSAGSAMDGVLPRLAALLGRQGVTEEWVLNTISDRGPGAACVLDSVLEMATSEDPAVREAVGRSVGAIGVCSAAAITVLRRLQGDEDGEVREAATEALRSLGRE
jgi:HEAT repeats